ncbi:MAG: hypothetical protein EBW89_03455 [Candidatus Fonsibacter ubiquis]|nr:hypothetical protein [Candidatus Fonsibacter ubiquis]
MIRALIISIFFSLLVGCNTLSDAQKAEGQGKKVSQDKNQGTIFAETSLTFTSYGEIISIFLKKQTESITTVEAVSKRKLETNIFAKEWADEIHLEIAKELKK